MPRALHRATGRRGSFFEDYKKNENKEVKVDEILGREEALKAIRDAMVRAVHALPHACCVACLCSQRIPFAVPQ